MHLPSRFGTAAIVEWYRGAALERRRRVGISLIVISLVILVTINVLSGSEIKTAQEVAFERYSNALEQAAMLGDSDSIALPSIKLQIGSTADNSQSYLIDSGRKEVILRLLVLFREARLFRLSGQAYGEDPADPLLSFRIEAPDQIFEGTYRRSQLQGNIKLETLLKLIAVQGQIN